MMRRFLIGLVRGYQLFISSWLGPSCRYYPTCSAYAIESLRNHGALAGSYLTVHRIARCGPWCQGGDDPVPLEKPSLFTHLLSPSPKKNS